MGVGSPGSFLPLRGHRAAGPKSRDHRAQWVGAGMSSNTRRLKERLKELCFSDMRAERMSPFLALGLLLAGICSVHCLPENVMVKDQRRRVDDHTLAIQQHRLRLQPLQAVGFEEPQ